MSAAGIRLDDATTRLDYYEGASRWSESAECSAPRQRGGDGRSRPAVQWQLPGTAFEPDMSVNRAMAR